MLSNHIIKTILNNIEHKPTEDQNKLIKGLAEFITNDNYNVSFLIKGYAGTGKTTMISTLVKAFIELKIKSILLAPTGRAAKVISSYSKKQAYTIHKKIYRQKSSKDGFGRFVLDANLHSNTFFIVDESSMIANQSFENSVFGTGRLLDDLIKYVYNDKNCKLILIGDTAQLPPVGISVSPALNKTELNSFGLKTFEYNLTEVVRQKEGTGILTNATRIRECIIQDRRVFPKINLKEKLDVYRITGESLVDLISESYDKNGCEDTIIITRSNKRANQYNKGIRSQILWKEEEISIGDLLMVVKNNYYWAEDNDEIDFIANGDIAEIIRINKYEEKYGYRFADVVLNFIDYDNLELNCKIILDTLNIDSAALSSEDNKKFFYKILEDCQEIKTKKKQYECVRNNTYFNALQVKFAYAITCHKAQGGQWKNVFIDHGYLTEQMVNKEFLRWMYTAFTRATEKLYLVNFNKNFFDDEDETILYE